MSVDISFGICYGMIINDETDSKIRDRIEAGDNENDFDAWECVWSRYLNAWVGGDHFVGIINTLNNEEGVACLIDKDNLIFDKEEEREFLKIYNKYNLQDFFEWEPRVYAVSFVS